MSNSTCEDDLITKSVRITKPSNHVLIYMYIVYA